MVNLNNDTFNLSQKDNKYATTLINQQKISTAPHTVMDSCAEQ